MQVPPTPLTWQLGGGAPEEPEELEELDEPSAL
jgi:hypothetical protein